MNKKTTISIIVVVIFLIVFSSTDKIYADSLIGAGTRLVVNGHSVNGYLTINGKRYDVSDMIIHVIPETKVIRLGGYLDNDRQVLLMVTGVNIKGLKYEFDGTLVHNDIAKPVKFTYFFVAPQVGKYVPPITKPKPKPLLPMMMIIEHYDRVYVRYVYAISVKLFDPKTNPDKNFFQFYGEISNVNVTATIFDQDGQVFHQFSGVTNKKGIYVASIIVPDRNYPDQVFQVEVNASKKGYIPQSVTLPIVVLHIIHEGIQQNAPFAYTPAQLIQDLTNVVQNMNLPHGIENSLVSSLDAALNSVIDGKNTVAQNQLNAFINKVNAQTGKALTDAQAQQLIGSAQNIINSIS